MRILNRFGSECCGAKTKYRWDYRICVKCGKKCVVVKLYTHNTRENVFDNKKVGVVK
jgi:hypothetical protein